MNKLHIKFYAVIFLIGIVFQTILQSQEMEDKVEWSIEFANHQMKNTILEMNNDSTQHPNHTNSDTGVWDLSSKTWWTSGFFAGASWYLYELTFNNPYWKDVATRWTKNLEPQKFDTSNHDVGFQIFCSYGNAYRLTGKEEYKEVILTTAKSLASRYDETIGMIRSWSWGSWNYPVIIDNMMNLELLLWAAENGGNENLRTIAINHAKKTITDHIRPNGSTYHVVDYNNDGTVKGKSTHQGYSTESTWSRGQAWGIYGFTVMYRFTKNDTFLTAAKNLADYFIDNLPADYIPYTDFEDPSNPNSTRDASASAITASALLELQNYIDDEKYTIASINILNSLMSNYIAKNTIHHSILHRGTVRVGDTERGIIYADYYFLEALKRYKDLTTNINFGKKINDFGFELYQNYPNPFNPTTTINYTIPSKIPRLGGFVTLKVYNILGGKVATIVNQVQQPGSYSVQFDTASSSDKGKMTSGIYFYQLRSAGMQVSKKMIFIE